MARKLTAADKKNKNATTVMQQKRKAKSIANKAAKKADHSAERSKKAATFWGGTPENKKRSSGKGLASGARKIAIEQSKKSTKSTIKAARLRGAAKKIK